MSTSTVRLPVAPTRPGPTGPPDGRPGIPFRRTVRLEIRKIVDTRSGRWLLVSIALVTAAVLGLVLRFAEPAEDLSFNGFVTLTSLPQLLLYPVLGILATTAEFSQRTGLVTFTVEPRRHRVVGAKLVAGCGWGLVGLAVAVALAAAAHGAAIVFRDAPAAWGLDGSVLAGFVVAQLLSVAQGVAFGLLLTSPAAAIVAFFVLPTAWSALAGFVPFVGRAAPWLDVGRSTDALLGGSMRGADWAHLATSSGLWVLLPLVVGALLLHRRELK
jgi:ABC-2 type transport system permease protein